MNPIHFQFVAAGAATQAKGLLYRFQPSRKGQAPSWEGRENGMTARSLPVPITDKSYWEGRYALCELTMEKADGERLVMNDAVVSVSRSKNIVMTPLIGRSGTVKEYINDGDYSINIVVGVAAVRDGVLVDEYPTEGLRELRGFLDVKEAIRVYSEFLDLFDISGMVIQSFSATQETAGNYQSVSITAVSDEEYNLYSTDY